MEAVTRKSRLERSIRMLFGCSYYFKYILSIFLGTIVISGEISGTHWMSYIRKFEWDNNIDLLRQLLLLE